MGSLLVIREFVGPIAGRRQLVTVPEGLEVSDADPQLAALQAAGVRMVPLTDAVRAVLAKGDRRPGFAADAVLEVAMAGGLPSGGSSVWMPDAPPATPNAMDDEFAADGALDPAWSLFSQAGKLSAAVLNGRLRLTKQSDVGVDTAGIFKAIPVVADWSVTTKVIIRRTQTGVMLAGLFLAEDIVGSPATANFCQLAISVVDNAIVRLNRLSFDAGATPTAIVSYANFFSAYLRIRVSSGTVYMDWSRNGEDWISAGAVVTGLSSIDYVGIAVDNRTGVDQEFLVPFVRFTDSSDFRQDLGGLV